MIWLRYLMVVCENVPITFRILEVGDLEVLQMFNGCVMYISSDFPGDDDRWSTT